MDQVKFFKGCLPQILLGPFLNTLAHMCVFILRPFLFPYRWDGARTISSDYEMTGCPSY